MSVLQRCPSYRESNKGSKEKQGPTLGVRLIGVSVKRELTVLLKQYLVHMHVHKTNWKKQFSGVLSHDLQWETNYKLQKSSSALGLAQIGIDSEIRDIFCLWFLESAKISLVESRILGFGIWNTAQGIRNPTNDQVPLAKTGIQYLESGIHGVESRIQDCLGFPYMEQLVTWSRCQVLFLQ